MHSADDVRHPAELQLRGGELLLKSDMRGSEALVVDEQSLDFPVLRGELLFDHGGLERTVRRMRRSYRSMVVGEGVASGSGEIRVWLGEWSPVSAHRWGRSQRLGLLTASESVKGFLTILLGFI